MKLSEKLKKSSEYETVKNIHDYMVSNIAYTSNDNDDVQYTLSGALNNFACVCSGYAKAFYFLCEASGIDTVIVTGNTKGSDLGHAWNKVKIEGKWYSIDTTWDDPVPDKPGVVEYIYFLLTDEDLAVDHIWDNSGLPEAVSDDLGYLYITYKDVLRLENDKEAMKYIMAELENAKANSSEKFTYEIEFIVKDGEDIYNNLLNLAVQYHNDFGCGYSTSGKNLKVMGRYYYIKVYK
ncbi:MAG: hypothetical protein IKP88_02775 [Lachnospiraceae bacterium]|nr:hypothetical protein [Lachnospiraceae bacterium]